MDQSPVTIGPEVDPEAELRGVMLKAIAAGLVKDQLEAAIKTLGRVGLSRERLIALLAEQVARAVGKAVAEHDRRLVRLAKGTAEGIARQSVTDELERMLP